MIFQTKGSRPYHATIYSAMKLTVRMLSFLQISSLIMARAVGAFQLSKISPPFAVSSGMVHPVDSFSIASRSSGYNTLQLPMTNSVVDSVGVVSLAPPPKIKIQQNGAVKKKGDFTIYVKNLPYEVSDKEVRDIFKGFGKIERVSILMNRTNGKPTGIAFVKMVSSDEFEKAIVNTNSTIIKGRKLFVTRAVSSKCKFIIKKVKKSPTF